MGETALEDQKTTVTGQALRLLSPAKTIEAIVDIDELEGEELFSEVLRLAGTEPARWGNYANRINNFMDSVISGDYSIAYSIATKEEPGRIPFASDLKDYAVRHFGGLSSDSELIRGSMDRDRFALHAVVNRELQGAGLKAGIVLTLVKYLRSEPANLAGAYYTAKDGGLTAPLVDGTAKLYFGSLHK